MQSAGGRQQHLTARIPHAQRRLCAFVMVLFIWSFCCCLRLYLSFCKSATNHRWLFVWSPKRSPCTLAQLAHSPLRHLPLGAQFERKPGRYSLTRDGWTRVYACYAKADGHNKWLCNFVFVQTPLSFPTNCVGLIIVLFGGRQRADSVQNENKNGESLQRKMVSHRSRCDRKLVR